MFSPETLLYALLGGILPVLLWLWFWLKEDARHPEPRGLIMLSFIAGMAAVLVALPLEKFALRLIQETTQLIVAWSIIEEVLKFAAVIFIAMRTRFFDEPADALVYMITAALGFAALENTLFLLGPFSDGQITAGVVTGNLRYLGAALLHVAASGAVGVLIGLTFYKGRFAKTISALFGLSIAVLLHTLFNFFIIKDNGANMFLVFLYLWITIVVIIFFFERLKRMMRVTYLTDAPIPVSMKDERM